MNVPVTSNSRGLDGFSKRISAELILSDGSRRFFRCREVRKSKALNEVLAFVASVEKSTNDRVMWRFKGDSIYHMGANMNEPIQEKGLLKRVLNYFFDLEDY